MTSRAIVPLRPPVIETRRSGLGDATTVQTDAPEPSSAQLYAVYGAAVLIPAFIGWKMKGFAGLVAGFGLGTGIVYLSSKDVVGT